MSYGKKRSTRLACWLGMIMVAYQSPGLYIIRLSWVLDLALDSI